MNPSPPFRATELDSPSSGGIGLSADVLRYEESVRTTSWRRIALVLLDLTCWVASVGLLLGCLSWFGRESFIPNIWVFILPGVAAIIATALVRGYHPGYEFRSLRFAAEHLIAQCVAAAVGAGAVSMLINYGLTNQPSRLLLLVPGLPFWALSLWIRRNLIARSPYLNPSRHLLLVGTQEEADVLQCALLRAGHTLAIEPLPADQLRVRLRRLTRSIPVPVEGSGRSTTRLLPGPESISTDQHQQPLAGVVIAPSAPALSADDVGCLAAAHATAVPVFTWSNFFEQRLGRVDTSDLHALWLFDSDFRLAQHSAWWSLKRIFDFLTSAVLLALTAPLMLILAIVIKLDSRGPVLFRQERIGFRGRHFTICKFRTMNVVQSHNGTTTRGDERITKAGRWLRKARLDELPQLWNVFRGDMSLIGPRPEWTDCVADYEKHIPFYHLRHLARPGITGWAQVNYHYGGGRDDAREKLAYDLFYIRNFSPTLDCSILLKTIYVVICGQGGR